MPGTYDGKVREALRIERSPARTEAPRSHFGKQEFSPSRHVKKSPVRGTDRAEQGSDPMWMARKTSATFRPWHAESFVSKKPSCGGG